MRSGVSTTVVPPGLGCADAGLALVLNITAGVGAVAAGRAGEQAVKAGLPP